MQRLDLFEAWPGEKYLLKIASKPVKGRGDPAKEFFFTALDLNLGETVAVRCPQELARRLSQVSRELGISLHDPDTPAIRIEIDTEVPRFLARCECEAKWDPEAWERACMETCEAWEGPLTLSEGCGRPVFDNDPDVVEYMRGHSAEDVLPAFLVYVSEYSGDETALVASEMLKAMRQARG
jgi:hypothetical protein